MNKLEEKLEELGYEFDTFYFHKCIHMNLSKFEIVLYFKNKNLFEYKLFMYSETDGFIPYIKTQQDISDLQQAFNEMERDLEILKGVEND